MQDRGKEEKNCIKKKQNPNKFTIHFHINADEIRAGWTQVPMRHDQKEKFFIFFSMARTSCRLFIVERRRTVEEF